MPGGDTTKMPGGDTNMMHGSGSHMMYGAGSSGYYEGYDDNSWSFFGMFGGGDSSSYYSGSDFDCATACQQGWIADGYCDDWCIEQGCFEHDGDDCNESGSNPRRSLTSALGSYMNNMQNARG